MQPLTSPYVYGVNRRSENFLLLSDLLFAWGRCTKSRYKRRVIRVVLGCVFNFMMKFGHKYLKKKKYLLHWLVRCHNHLDVPFFHWQSSEEYKNKMSHDSKT